MSMKGEDPLEGSVEGGGGEGKSRNDEQSSGRGQLGPLPARALSVFSQVRCSCISGVRAALSVSKVF